ncbi:DUF262 domain-containing protein [Rhodococcus sp. 06-235-1A]|uniref:DUF262 domain-containing protein n=1 Tax=Rhodococcus sp. 06-235-1A TaxID=2022508 RepID=UPI001C52AFFF|nr:DUF262 domain-containing protein [Rhodococcus sp. 06-235-1A]
MATTSILQQYKIHDFLGWDEDQTLIINRDFQRREIWAPTAKVMLIDTILRGMPMPKIYLRTKIDLTTKKSLREIVDGQQRIRSIIEFAAGDLRLTRRAEEFAGLIYDDLSEEQQEAFLTYPIAVDQLVNADDTDVLEVFARLNSYTVSLSPAEKRHAKFQGEFKWEVVRSAVRWRVLWDVFGVIQGRDRLRMKDDELMAEIYGVAIEGLQDGGASRIDSLYQKYDDEIPNAGEIRSKVDRVLEQIVDKFGSIIRETEIRRSTQFLTLFAAMSRVDDQKSRIDVESARNRLRELASAIDEGVTSGKYAGFVSASKGSTQRISTRQIRAGAYYWAITGQDRIEKFG